MMQTDRKLRIIQSLNRQIRELRKARQEALISGVSAATLSTSGNSQSYTRWKIEDFDKAIANLQRERDAITNGSVLKRVFADFS